MSIFYRENVWLAERIEISCKNKYFLVCKFSSANGHLELALSWLRPRLDLVVTFFERFDQTFTLKILHLIESCILILCFDWHVWSVTSLLLLLNSRRLLSTNTCGIEVVSASCFKSSDQIKKRLHDYDQVKGLCQICGSKSSPAVNTFYLWKIHLSPMIDCVDVMSQRNVESIVKALVLNLFWLADPLGLYFEHKVPYIKADAN